MTQKTASTKSILTIIDDLLTIFQLVQDVPQLWDDSLTAYQASIRQMPERITEGQLKIAVVGAIKSGKSTFVNSLLGKELVKRGAGVVTSITTRIRKGKKYQATVYFKSWDQINAQLQKALLLFPDNGSGLETVNDFDIRRINDRHFLEKAYKQLVHEFYDTTTEIRPETLLIQYALCGFDACKDLIQADETLIRFSSREFDKYKAYTADPNMAFYVKDVCVDVFGKTMDPNIEIADCQGADSPDPAQLAQVINYLESSNLIVYCISSRIGLRQSDITFLKQIKNLGLLDNMVFVNNCDLTEHDNLDDLIKIENSIEQTLEFLEIQPRIFTLSSLYNLFTALESRLNKKELSRLRLWQEEKKIVDYCDTKTVAFNSFFKQVIDENRYDLLISNHLKRLDLIAGQLDRKTDMVLDLLSSDRIKEQTAKKALNALHQNAFRLEAIVGNSLDGAVQGLKEDIELDLKNTFVHDDKALLKNARDYIASSFLDVEKYKSVANESGFKHILYLMFQDFKRNLERYVLETVKPELKRFVQDGEAKISAYFHSLFDSYQIDLLKSDAYSQFETGSKWTKQSIDDETCIDINEIKKILGLQLPVRIFEAQYSTRIQTRVFADFGLHSMVNLLSSLFGKKSDFSFSPGLRTAAVKIKKENQKIIKDQFEQVHRDLRDNYFLPLINAATRDFKEKIKARFNQYHSIKEDISHSFSLKNDQKTEQKKKIQDIKYKLEKLSIDIASCTETGLT